MSPKRKSNTNSSKWLKCQKCETFVKSEDSEFHLSECSPLRDNWNHNFIKNSVLYTSLEIYSKALPQNISKTNADNLVFISESAMELCNIAMGDEVLITGKTVIVKSAFPSNNEDVAKIFLTKTAFELSNLGDQVKLQKLREAPNLAKEVLIEYLGQQPLPSLSTEFDLMIRSQNEESIFAIGNKFCIPYYGRKLIFRVTRVKFDTDSRSEEEKEINDLSRELLDLNICQDYRDLQFFKTIYCTKWLILESKSEDNRKKKRLKLEDIGGYDDLIGNLRNLLDDALGLCQETSDFNPIRGIVLYGPPGVGKSMIANTLISEYSVYSTTISLLNLIPKDPDTEISIKDILDTAIARAPSIILLEDINILCPKESSSSTEQENKLLATLINFFDELRLSNDNVAVLATTSKQDSINNSLRRAGRLQKEFEVSVPDCRMRKEILARILSRISNSLTDEDIAKVSSETHGFVAADLEGLCSEARYRARERLLGEKKLPMRMKNVQVTVEDVRFALRDVNPSAMKEVLVQVPNVKWSEIGGQRNLKMKLKQAVEWPLKHPEVFQRMGIVPPKGVLMFGPPGCSKTMIAKALATESQLNFLNINGPELFSKWVGDSEKAVREIFRKARQVAPSIVFIDEIDALGGERATSSKGAGSNVQERVLTQLLTELDGITALGNVTLVAATNRPDRIDKALLRPGRLDRIIYVPLPDVETRKEIFSIKLKNMPIASDIVIQDLVDITEGYSGAEIQAVCHEAAMNALELDLSATEITKEHFRTALSIVKPRTSVSLIKIYDSYIANGDLQASRTACAQ